MKATSGTTDLHLAARQAKTMYCAKGNLPAASVAVELVRGQVLFTILRIFVGVELPLCICSDRVRTGWEGREGESQFWVVFVDIEFWFKGSQGCYTSSNCSVRKRGWWWSGWQNMLQASFDVGTVSFQLWIRWGGGVREEMDVPLITCGHGWWCVQILRDAAVPAG